ncbi:MAG: NUDIX hydrolase [Chloroflexi bacterium]|nr:NUDIX hydrolase [Chloroflexota bacterium]
MTKETVVKRDVVFEGRLFDVHIDHIRTDQGKEYVREIVQHKGAVAVVPIDPDGKVIMVRQFRSGAGKSLLEIPAGGLEEGEEREASARRELQEEIHYYPNELIELGDFWVAAGYTTERITIYLASDLKPSELPADADEDLTIEKVPFTEALERALTNQFVDSKTIIGLLWAARHLGKLST